MTTQSILLGVNIDHVATLRQARGTAYPDPLEAAKCVESAGADGLTLHLREDRRHIQDLDVVLIKEQITIPMNFEMAVTDEMIAFAKKIKPAHCCLVPEKREELTTEGGLDVLSQFERIKKAVNELSASGINVSLFIDPDEKQIDAASQTGAPTVEIHTGSYADAKPDKIQKELDIIISAVAQADNLGLRVNAGHGLNINNVSAVAAIPQIHELNIGHSIIARAIFIGLAQSIQEMKEIMLSANKVVIV